MTRYSKHILTLLLSPLFLLLNPALAHNLQHTNEVREKLSTPSKDIMTVVSYQREVEIFVKSPEDKGLTYQLKIDDSTDYFTVQNGYCVIDKLEPGKVYKVCIRAKRGTQVSEFSPERYVFTNSMNTNEKDKLRIPHLAELDNTERPNIVRQGIVKTHFNDLITSDATIKYEVNGKEVHPEHYRLTLPQGGNVKLRISIDEKKPGCRWVLTYVVDVR